MKRENESLYLSAKGSSYIDEDAGPPSHYTTVSDTKMNGMSFETFLHTRLKFIPPTRKVFAASEYFIEISVCQTIEHTMISIKKISNKPRTQSPVIFF